MLLRSKKSKWRFVQGGVVILSTQPFYFVIFHFAFAFATWRIFAMIETLKRNCISGAAAASRLFTFLTTLLVGFLELLDIFLLFYYYYNLYNMGLCLVKKQRDARDD